MASPPLVTYWHRQIAPWSVLLYALSALLLSVGWGWQHEPIVSLVLPLTGLVMLVLAPAFHHLTVADEGDVLAIRFGPLPLFRTAVRYSDLRRLEISRTTWLDRWGIHLSLRGGWVWNIWGRDCVVLHLRNGGIVRLGTDDVENLAGFLQTRLDDERERQK